MALVNYSDSETSDVEEAPASPSKLSKPTVTASKPSFQKVVDRSNPHKIRVNLPQTSKDTDENSADRNGEPPSKRLRTGGGGAFRGFNAMLPAPKKTGQLGGGGSSTSGRGGPPRGISLKTGAAPGFSREESLDNSKIQDLSWGGPGLTETSTNGISELDQTPGSPDDQPPQSQGPEAQTKPLEKPTMFKPLSVARKPPKQKKASASAAPQNVPPKADPPPQSSAHLPSQVSLFSFGGEGDGPQTRPSSGPRNGAYKPLVYSPREEQPPHESSPPLETLPVLSPTDEPTSHVRDHDPNSLASIARDLNLSQAEMRKLFGRQKAGGALPAAVQVKNFNTDAEYASNEALRATGETVQHNPVRSIAPGKHNLKQLVSAVSDQKDALEEQFAKGRRNKKEAGGKYGW